MSHFILISATFYYCLKLLVLKSSLHCSDTAGWMQEGYTACQRQSSKTTARSFRVLGLPAVTPEKTPIKWPIFQDNLGKPAPER